MYTFAVHIVIKDGTKKNLHGFYPILYKGQQVETEKLTFSHQIEAEGAKEAEAQLLNDLKGPYDFYIKEISNGSTI